MGVLQLFQDCGAIIREIAGRVKRILDMPAMFVWYFKEENTLRFWRLCGRIEKTRRKETAVTLQLCHGCCRHYQPCSAAVLYFSAQPDQCYPGAGTGSGAGAFQDGKLCGEPDAAGISEILPAAKGCTADKIRANSEGNTHCSSTTLRQDAEHLKKSCLGLDIVQSSWSRMPPYCNL